MAQGRIINTQREADSAAAALGATRVGVETFVGRRDLFGHRSRHVFARYYFGEDGCELAHWIVDVRAFQAFDTPRVWHSAMEANLSISRLRPGA